MKRMTLKQLATTAVIAAAIAIAVGVTASYQPKAKQMTREQKLERGEYLVTIGGCHDCHTPWKVQADGKPGPDMDRALSGHPQSMPLQPAKTSDGWGWSAAPTNTAFSGAWGVSFAANLSPDVNTGTGVWTFDTFRNTIRRGRHWGVSRPLLPPMPWFNYRHMTDEDLESVFTYIHSLKPVHNRVPDPIPPAAESTAIASAETLKTSIDN